MCDGSGGGVRGGVKLSHTRVTLSHTRVTLSHARVTLSRRSEMFH